VQKFNIFTLTNIFCFWGRPTNWVSAESLLHPFKVTRKFYEWSDLEDSFCSEILNSREVLAVFLIRFFWVKD
jgi:hypothetical protein